MAPGRPYAVRIDAALGLIETLRIDQPGAAPSQAPSPTGDQARELLIENGFPGAAIAAFVNRDGASARDAIWFDFTGAPHLRAADGAEIGPFTADALITVSGGHTVAVRRSTGLIER